MPGFECSSETAHRALRHQPPPVTGRARIGLLFPGDVADPTSWSGIPASLSRALESQVGSVIHVSTEPPQLLARALVNGTALLRLHRFGLTSPLGAARQARWQARATPAVVAARSRFAQRRLERFEGLDAVVQIHAECPVKTESPLATYEDMTVVQALRHRYAEFARMSPSEARRRVTRQGRVYEQAAACCVTTHWARQSIVNDYGIPPGKVHVVGIGNNRLCQEHDRDWTTPRFLFVGLDWDRKNGAAVLRAFARLRSRHGDAELHLVGGHPSVDEPGVVPHGFLRPSRSADQDLLDRLFERATCFVLPSQVEPSAVAYVEAAACGIPSIGTTIGGSADLVGPGGLLVDPSSDEELFLAMSRLCDGEYAATLGGQARRHARAFTWDRVAARILTALRLPGSAESPLSER